MKKLLLSCVLLIGMGGLKAQMSENAIGLRFGGGNGFGNEITYQRALSAINRVQLDLGARRGNASQLFKISGTYQWVKPLQNDFQWFYGVGAGFAYVDFDKSIPIITAEDYGTSLLTLEGIVGIEYSLANTAGIPLQIALDLNPNINLLNDYYDDFDLDLALSVRWMF